MTDFFAQAAAQLQEIRRSVPQYEPPAPRAPAVVALPRRINTYSEAGALVDQVAPDHGLDLRINFWAAADCYILLAQTFRVRRSEDRSFLLRWVSLDLSDAELIAQLTEMADIVNKLELQST